MEAGQTSAVIRGELSLCALARKGLLFAWELYKLRAALFYQAQTLLPQPFYCLDFLLVFSLLASFRVTSILPEPRDPLKAFLVLAQRLTAKEKCSWPLGKGGGLL